MGVGGWVLSQIIRQIQEHPPLIGPVKLPDWLRNDADAGEDDERNPAQDKRLSPREIRRLQRGGEDPEELKGGKRTGEMDLFKDRRGNVYVKPKNGSGPGDPLGLNINDF